MIMRRPPRIGSVGVWRQLWRRSGFLGKQLRVGRVFRVWEKDGLH